MDFLRTPDACFDKLPGFDYAPRYLDGLQPAPDLRMAYVDEGPRDAKQIFLCLHGQPAWSYLYRKMVPVFADDGYRVIAPDMIGFGRSDKPVSEDAHGFYFHRDMLLAFIEALGLSRFVLVCQDWGGIFGLSLAADISDKLAGLLVMNTAMPVGQSLGPGFEKWRAYSARTPDLDVGALVARGNPHLSQPEIDAYNAPFPDACYKAALRRFPEMVMTREGMEGVDTMTRAASFWKDQWDGPTLMAVGMQDPVFGPDHMERLRQDIRGCPPCMEIAQGGHFVQEHGEMIAEEALSQGLGNLA